MMIEEHPIPEDLSWVRLRPADEAECAVEGMTGAEAVAQSAATSVESYMVTIDGKPVAFWGYGLEGFMSQVAYGWLLTMDGVDAERIRLARITRRVVAYILTKAPTLAVITHTEHHTACRWLEWLGFEPLAAPMNNGLQYMIKRR
jgi:hypothetical protein